MRQLSSEELKLACPNYDDVLKRLNEATNDARALRTDWTPQTFGTEVHSRVARGVNGYSDTPPGFRSPDRPQNEDYRAEFSILKARAADPITPPARYGQAGTVRIDVFERVNDQRICVYDIKTGSQPLTLPRSLEIGANVRRRYPNAQSIIVAEARADQ